MIDPHVHLRDWAQSDSETIKHGLTVAKMCGFTHVFDMPNTLPKPVATREVLRERLELARKSAVDGISYHTYIALTADPLQIFKAVNMYNEFFPTVIGFKLYAGPSTGNLEVSETEKISLVFKTLKERGYKGVVAVHCEKKELFQENMFIDDDYSTYSFSRPTESEVESISDVLDEAGDVGFEGTVHIAHLSCADSIDMVKIKRREYPELKVTFAITPHHALLSYEDAKDHSRFLKVNPPLRSESDRDAMFNALLDGTANWIESDHAPHSMYHKSFDGACGLPGFAGYLHLIKKLREADIDKGILEGLIGYNAAKVFGIEVSEDDVIVPRSYVSISRAAQKEYKHMPYNLEVGE